MGKASRIRQQSAREKIAAQRAAAERARKRNIAFTTIGSIVVVAAIVLAFVIIKTNSNSPSKGSGSTLTASQTVPIINKLSAVPASTLTAVGKGTTYPHMLIPVNGTPLSSGGKPEVLYMGAEYCPFCATERWAMAVAFSRFGTFHNVSAIHSSPTDTPSFIPTLTFYKSSYTSKYVTFTPVEMQTVSRAPLQKPTAAQNALISKYDAPPYVSGTSGSIPFMYFGGKWIISGASYDYSVLQGKTWSQVASALHDPSSPIAKGALGAANQMTAAICKLTNNQPANVCGTSLIKNLQGQL